MFGNLVLRRKRFKAGAYSRSSHFFLMCSWFLGTVFGSCLPCYWKMSEKFMFSHWKVCYFLQLDFLRVLWCFSTFTPLHSGIEFLPLVRQTGRKAGCLSLPLSFGSTHHCTDNKLIYPKTLRKITERKKKRTIQLFNNKSSFFDIALIKTLLPSSVT